jgi:hypothetical protein
MKATRAQTKQLLQRYGIAVGLGGSDSRKAARGGRVGRLSIERQDDIEMLTIVVGEHQLKSGAPRDVDDARRIVGLMRAQRTLSEDQSFERMLAHLLLKATKLFDECGATRLEFSPLHLHPTSYHIEKVILLHEKPLRITPRLEPDSHDRRAVFDHRHGDSIKNPK